MNSHYDRQQIAVRVLQLRDGQKMPFTSIAAVLNAEGFKPRSAASFSQATVYQIYKSASESMSVPA